jgi:putative FmdB family regulatory protein
LVLLPIRAAGGPGISDPLPGFQSLASAITAGPRSGEHRAVHYHWHSIPESARFDPSTSDQEDDVPTYVYACTECDHGFEAHQAFTDDALTTCPNCNGKLRKVFNSVGIVFKGSGFYRTDSRSDGKSGSDPASSSSSASNGSSGSSSSGSDSSGNSSDSKAPAAGGSTNGGTGSSSTPAKSGASSSASAGSSGSSSTSSTSSSGSAA